MFEAIRIRIFGIQPSAKVTDKTLEHLIQREFGSKADDVKQKLQQVTSDTRGGKNRISAAILKLSNKDFNSIDYYINISKNDFRDVIFQAEYAKCAKLDFNKMAKQMMKRIYLEDWIDIQIG